MTSTTIRHTLHREYVDFVDFKKNESRMYKDLSNNPQKIYKPQNDYHKKQSINVITVTSVFMTVVPMGQTGSPWVTFIHLSQNSISRDKWSDVPPVTQPTVANHWKKTSLRTQSKALVSTCRPTPAAAAHGRSSMRH